MPAAMGCHWLLCGCRTPGVCRPAPPKFRSTTQQLSAQTSTGKWLAGAPLPAAGAGSAARGLDAGVGGCVLRASGLSQATAALAVPASPARTPPRPPCSGHCPHDDTPELVNTQLTRWLAQLPAETA